MGDYKCPKNNKTTKTEKHLQFSFLTPENKTEKKKFFFQFFFFWFSVLGHNYFSQ